MAGALMGSYSTLPAGGATVYDGTATHEPSNAETIYHMSGQSGYGAPGYAYAGGNGQAQGFLPPAIQAVVDVIQGGGTVAAGLAETFGTDGLGSEVGVPMIFNGGLQVVRGVGEVMNLTDGNGNTAVLDRGPNLPPLPPTDPIVLPPTPPPGYEGALTGEQATQLANASSGVTTILTDGVGVNAGGAETVALEVWHIQTARNNVAGDDLKDYFWQVLQQRANYSTGHRSPDFILGRQVAGALDAIPHWHVVYDRTDLVATESLLECVARQNAGATSVSQVQDCIVVQINDGFEYVCTVSTSAYDRDLHVMFAPHNGGPARSVLGDLEAAMTLLPVIWD